MHPEDHGEKKIVDLDLTAVHVSPLVDLERGRLSDTRCTLKITVRRVEWVYTGILLGRRVVWI